MPGVLIIDSMAANRDCSCCWRFQTAIKSYCISVAVDAARFRRPVVPGDQLRVEMKVLPGVGTLQTRRKATVDGQLAEEATLMSRW